MSDQNLLRPDPLIPLDPTSPAGLLRLAAFIRGREDSDASADMLARGYQELHAQLSTAKADGAREEAERWSSRLMCDSIDSLCPECGSCTWGRPYVDLKPDLSRRVCSQCDAIRPEPATPEEDETP